MIAFWGLNATTAVLVGGIIVVAACLVAVRRILASRPEGLAARTALMLGALFFFVGLGGVVACPAGVWPVRVLFAAPMALGGIIATVIWLKLGAVFFFMGLGGVVACPAGIWPVRAVLAALMALGGLIATVTLVDRYFGEK
ncbi:MAG: hypothetical protein QGH74_02030 [Candidatus Brocadiia bacterium]|nr:hypothetical protein [Candidatus Brocadiia bacterium]